MDWDCPYAIFIEFLISFGLNLVLRKGEVYLYVIHSSSDLHMPEQATYQKADLNSSCQEANTVRSKASSWYAKLLKSNFNFLEGVESGKTPLDLLKALPAQSNDGFYMTYHCHNTLLFQYYECDFFFFFFFNKHRDNKFFKQPSGEWEAYPNINYLSHYKKGCK